jgi:hypothetical protein
MVIWCDSPLQAVVVGPVATIAMAVYDKNIARRASKKTLAELVEKVKATRRSADPVVAERERLRCVNYKGDDVELDPDHLVKAVTRDCVQRSIRAESDKLPSATVNGEIERFAMSLADETLQLLRSEENQLKTAIRNSWAYYRGGGLWAGWYAYVSFLRDVCGWEHESLENFAHDEKCAIAAWWIWYGRDVATIANRPYVLNTDEERRLHNEDGLAMAFRDGWKLWYIHGVAVPEKVVMAPEEQTLDEIAKERSAEVRRVRITRYGWTRYLNETGAKVIEQRTNDVDGTTEALMATRDNEHVFVCACPSTGRVYAMRVAREIKTCEEAQRWLHGQRDINIIGAS